jgi:hypothetical protein
VPDVIRVKGFAQNVIISNLNMFDICHAIKPHGNILFYADNVVSVCAFDTQCHLVLFLRFTFDLTLSGCPNFDLSIAFLQ